MTAQPKGRELTGRMVLAITLSFFGVIIAVNVVMATFAVQTFPGLEVRNTYVASQGFNDRLRAQQALGWSVDADLTGGVLRVDLRNAAGEPAPVASISGVLGRPTTERADIVPEFTFDGTAHVAQVQVDHGNWDLRLRATAADGTDFTYRVGLIHR